MGSLNDLEFKPIKDPKRVWAGVGLANCDETVSLNQRKRIIRYMERKQKRQLQRSELAWRLTC